MNRILLLGAFFCFFFGLKTEAQQRYLDPIFDDVTVETNVLYGVNATVITSSPGPMSKAISEIKRASVPEDTPMACFVPI